MGIHGLSCISSVGRLSRHSMLNDVVKRALGSAGCPSVLEPTGISRDDGKRPDGMTLIPWKNGLPLVWDATCSDTVAPSAAQSSTRHAGSVADAAARRKTAKYSNIIDDHYYFVPFAVETFGPWCKEALSFVTELGKRVEEATGEIRSTQYLRQRVSVAIQKGNAASVMGTIPTSASMPEIYYLL